MIYNKFTSLDRSEIVSHIPFKILFKYYALGLLDDNIFNTFDVYIWTVNITTKFEKYKQLGIKGIFTDYPKKFNIRINK